MSSKLLIVEESLRDLQAHWFEYIKTITRSAETQGWFVEVACHQDVVPEIQKDLKTFPIFRYARYLDTGKKKLPGEKYYGFLLHSWRCLQVLWPLLREKATHEHIFVPTVLVHHLLAWWIIMTFHPNKPQHLTLFFVSTLGHWDSQSKKSTIPATPLIKIQGFLLRLFSKHVEKGNLSLAVETKGAKKEYESLTNLPFKLFPHPVPPLEKYNFTGKDNHNLVFACYGFARYEKGSDILKNSLEKLLQEAQLPQTKFCVQWLKGFNLPDGSICELSKFLTENSQIEVINRPLNSKEYQKLLYQTDCMILPYRNSSYYARVSRVAIEAAYLGIPIIYTKGGWLEEIVEEFGAGISIQDENIEDLSDKIEIMVNNYHDFSEKAQRKKLLAKKYFSGDNFISLLFS